MKKHIVVLLCVLAAFCMNATAQDGLVTDFTTGEEPQLVTVGDYVLRGTTLVQYRGDAAEVIIPADLGLTEIGAEAFGRAGIRTVLIPEGVTKLGAMVFIDCYSLESLTLPRSLTGIGEGALSRCENLRSITVASPAPPRLNGSLWDLNSWPQPPALIYVPSAALDQYKNVEGWENHADKIYPMEGGDYVMRGTVLVGYRGNAEELHIPADLGLTEIGEGAFRGYSNLRTLSLPAGLTSIGEWAFYGCSSLRTVTLPSGLTSIGEWAFSSCSSLRTISLPAGLTSIGSFTFSDCGSLMTIDLPAGLTSIGEWAFYGCSSLTTIHLPAGLTSIEDGAFYACSNLGSITVASPQPPRLNGSLGISDSTLIYVPVASLDRYKNAEGWENHADMIRAAGN